MMPDPCQTCGNRLLWWRSRTAVLVCMRCAPNPLEALEALQQSVGKVVRERYEVCQGLGQGGQ
jgi:hypothetical protein